MSDAPPAGGVTTHERCPVCGQASLAPLGFHYRHGGQEYPCARCEACGIRFLQRRPGDADLAALYAGGYFESDYRCGHAGGDYFASETAYRAEDLALLEDFERWVPRGRLLEVGCAGGWLLKHARERGWVARGVELSEIAVQRARALGLDVFHGDLTAASFEPESFDLVYMGDVLEHVPDCLAVLRDTARVLRPHGVLYLRGPITTHSLARRLALAAARMTGRSLALDQPPYHLWEFTPASLEMLARRTGFEIRHLRQSKVPPTWSRPGKSAVESAVMAAVDAVNLPLTLAFNVLGDRVTLVALRTAVSGESPQTWPAAIAELARPSTAPAPG